MIIIEDSDCTTNESIQIEMIRAWLHKIGEPEEDHFIVLDKCKRDPEAVQYFYRHATGEFLIK
ncbi:hypothetical protein C7H79_02370 [Nitrosomonas supralitoralis]|uniref:Uncharacterized protein n=2 Tax=Nitrosomonas supralitoralis TaxID=2116706 RepID=A0A2P7NYA5_9PROT|nr:hypothetical protein C7H79_02370 [Nitrosomonas supralitoralis]